MPKYRCLAHVKGHEAASPVDPVTHESHGLAHGKGGKDRSETEAVQMSQKRKGHNARYGKAAHVKEYLYLRVSRAAYVRHLAREEIGRYDRQMAAV